MVPEPNRRSTLALSEQVAPERTALEGSEEHPAREGVRQPRGGPRASGRRAKQARRQSRPLECQVRGPRKAALGSQSQGAPQSVWCSHRPRGAQVRETWGLRTKSATMGHAGARAHARRCLPSGQWQEGKGRPARCATPGPSAPGMPRHPALRPRWGNRGLRRGRVLGPMLPLEGLWWRIEGVVRGPRGPGERPSPPGNATGGSPDTGLGCRISWVPGLGGCMRPAPVQRTNCRK